MALQAWQIILELIGIFCLSTLVGYMVTWAKRVQHGLSPEPGARVRIRGRHQIYHCRLESVQATGWSFTPPLVRDSYYPFSRGEEIIAEASVGSGRMLFRTVILCGDRLRGRIWVKPPEKSFYIEATPARDYLDSKAAPALLLK